MECYDDSDKKLCDYCESCSILVNFSYDLHQEINDYITNGGDINNVESLSVDTLIPILNQTCTQWALRITDDELTHKKGNIDFIRDTTIQALIMNLPFNLEERIKFLNQQVGLATIQITRISWFQNVFNNIMKSLK